MADDLNKSPDSVDPKPALPLVIAVNDGRGAAWGRLVLLAILAGLVMGLVGPAIADWFTEPPAPWKTEWLRHGVVAGAALAMTMGFIVLASLPRQWVITEDEIIQIGPTGQRRALRWSQIQRVNEGANQLGLYGPRGSKRVRLSLPQLPMPLRKVARAAIRERLEPYFLFPEPLTLTRRQFA